MLTEIYTEALLVDDELADQVWEAWDKGEIDDAVVFVDVVTDFTVRSALGAQRGLQSENCTASNKFGRV